MSRPAKRRRVSVEDRDGISDAAPSARGKSVSNSAFAQSAAQWDLEQAYEQRARKDKKGKDSGRLPVRTESGWAAPEPEPPVSDDDADSFLASDHGDGEESGEEAEAPSLIPQERAIPPKQQIRLAQEELARCAGLVNEDPEEHVGALRTIAQFADSPLVTIKKLALATELAVYKDVIPGYRIRPHTEEDTGVKLSRDVRRLRNFEQSLVGGYQQYVKVLTEHAKLSRGDASAEQASLGAMAISCACELLKAVPHFNFRGELLKILVAKLSTKRRDADFHRCAEALQTLFATDEDGNASLEAVALLTKMIKARGYHVNEAVINTFLYLRLLSEFSLKGSHAGIDSAKQEGEINGKKPKQKREFRSKKQRKIMREQKAVAKEMKEADAAVGHEERDRMQAEMLKLVFVTYFRILKARTPSLMGAVLEGLARYAHLINQEFFGDILEALKDLISQQEGTDTAMAGGGNDSDDGGDDGEGDDADNEPETGRSDSRNSLLCIITAFALLQGQDASAAASTLSLDLSFFITHLYQTLFPASLNPDIELSDELQTTTATTAGAAARHGTDPPGTPPAPAGKVNVQTTAVLLLRSLNSALLPAQNLRAVPPTRVAAFAKNLMTASLQLPERSCLAMLALLQRVVKVHGKRIAALWYTEERKGDGVFDALKGAGGGEGSNPFAATVWEGELLRLHFCPKVRDGAKALEKALVASRG